MEKKQISVKPTLSFFLCLGLAILFGTSVYGQEAEVSRYPNRPITFIHPLPAGGVADVVTRVLCKEAEKSLGQPIIILNKPGGNLTIGAATLATSKPDGYTIGFTAASSLLIIPFMEKLPYHPLNDFQQIMQWGAPHFGVTVKADSPFKSFKDIVDYARQNPKKLSYGTTGTVGLHYLIMEQIARKEKVQFTQIPFKGGSEVETALLGGHIQFGASEFSVGQLETGGTRLLLLFREEPSPEYPQTPCLKDLGYGDIRAPMLQNIAGPKGMPEAIVKKLEDAFTKALKAPAVVKVMKETGFSVQYRDSKELTVYIATNYEFFEKFLKELNLVK